jgi:hypothetical protein
MLVAPSRARRVPSCGSGAAGAASIDTGASSDGAGRFSCATGVLYGFTRVHNMFGGITAWEKLDLPVLVIPPQDHEQAEKVAPGKSDSPSQLVLGFIFGIVFG